MQQQPVHAAAAASGVTALEADTTLAAAAAVNGLLVTMPTIVEGCSEAVPARQAVLSGCLLLAPDVTSAKDRAQAATVKKHRRSAGLCKVLHTVLKPWKLRCLCKNA